MKTSAITSYRKNMNSLLDKKRSLISFHDKNKRDVKKARKELQDVISGQEITQTVAKEMQQRVYKNLANIVTHCLQYIFGRQYEFCLDFERKRNKTEAVLYFKKKGRRIDPMFDTGGGVVDVASFALQLSCLFLSKPKLRKFLALDEPFKFVSVEYRESLRNLIKSLSEDMKVQFLIVTHIEELRMGKIIRTKKENYNDR